MVEARRNEPLEASPGLDLTVAALQQRAHRVRRKAGAGRDLGRRKAARLQVGANARQGGVDRRDHVAHDGAKFCPTQACSAPDEQNLPRAELVPADYGQPMPYDRERLKRAMLRVAEQRGLNLSDWSLRAGLDKNTVRRFLGENATVESPTVKVIHQLADAAGVDVPTLMGIEPPRLDEAAYRTVADLLKRVQREHQLLLRRVSEEHAEGVAALSNIEDLLRAMRPSAGPPADQGNDDSPSPSEPGSQGHSRGA